MVDRVQDGYHGVEMMMLIMLLEEVDNDDCAVEGELDDDDCGVGIT